jgi:hypothetical protein
MFDRPVELAFRSHQRIDVARAVPSNCAAPPGDGVGPRRQRSGKWYCVSFQNPESITV